MKTFKIKAENIKQLIKPIGGCFASDKITCEGYLIGIMYREEPEFDHDSGWRFFSGTEDQEYVDNPDNLMIYDVNTIANYDMAIIDYLHLPFGSDLVRIKGTNRFEKRK